MASELTQSKEPADILALLSNTRILAGLPSSTVAQLRPATSLVALHDKEQLWWCGQPGAFIGVVISGLVQIVKTTVNGELNILSIFGPQEVVGLSAVLQGTPFPADAVAAAKNTVVMKISGPPLALAAQRDLALSQALSRALLQHTSALRTKIEVLSAGSIQARIAVLFIDLARRYGHESGDATMLPLDLSRGTIASLVSARVETVIRQMTHWQRERIIVKADGGFCLNLQQLEKAAHAG